MAKKGSKQKSFNRKRYNLSRTMEKKSDAQKLAKKLRKGGDLVRVIPVFRVYRKKLKKGKKK